MAEPKSRWSKARSRRHRNNWKLDGPTLVECPRCNQLMQSHKVCKNCGTYDGRQVISVNEAE